MLIKIVVLVAWTAVLCGFWPCRWELFGLIPADISSTIYPLFHFSMEALYWIFGLLGAMWILKSNPKAARIQKELREFGFHSDTNTYPRYLRKRRGIMPHEVVFVFTSGGIALPDWDKARADLGRALKARVLRCEYGAKGTKKVLVYAIPRKHDKPTLITVKDEAVGGISVYHMINALVVGNTGSGKSTFLGMLLAKYAKYIQGISITVCDYKKSSFARFKDTKNFYGYTAVPEGIRKVYQEFSERLMEDNEKRNQHICLLLIDEYGTLLSSLDKQTAFEIEMMVASMLCMGRSLGIFVLVGIQRAQAKFFENGSRDQFRVLVGMGNLSKIQKEMVFPDYKEDMIDNNKTGEGYLAIDGQEGIERFKAIPDGVEKFDEYIRKAMNR